VEDGAPYESLHVIPRAYPEGIAGVSFCNGNVLVTSSKDHQVSVANKHCTCVCVCVLTSRCVPVRLIQFVWLITCTSGTYL